MKSNAPGISLGAIALALSSSTLCEARVRLTTLSDNGGPASDLLACVGAAFPLEEQAKLGSNDFHAWLFVAKLEGVPATPHAVQLLLTVDELQPKGSEESLGVPLRFLSWRSFQGEATDAELCAEVAVAIRAGVADVGPGMRAIRQK